MELRAGDLGGTAAEGSDIGLADGGNRGRAGIGGGVQEWATLLLAYLFAEDTAKALQPKPEVESGQPTVKGWPS